MQQIGFKDLQIVCIIGLHEYERLEEQPLFFDVSIDTQGFIDYTELAELVKELAIQGRYVLIETLAQEAVAAIRAQWPEALHITIRVKKPKAIPEAAYAYCEVSC